MDPISEIESADTLQLTATVVTAYVSNNSVRAADLPALITQVHTALVGLSLPGAPPEVVVATTTAAQIKKSITPDALISFIDGKPYKTLKRHLATHGFSFESYRARYGLPDTYPSIAASYSATRSALARKLGLGQQRRKTAASPTTPVEAIAAPPPEGAPVEVIANAPPIPAKAPGRGRPRKAAEPAAE